MQREAVGDDFHYGFQRKDHKKDVLDELLRHKCKRHMKVGRQHSIRRSEAMHFSRKFQRKPF